MQDLLGYFRFSRRHNITSQFSAPLFLLTFFVTSCGTHPEGRTGRAETERETISISDSSSDSVQPAPESLTAVGVIADKFATEILEYETDWTKFPEIGPNLGAYEPGITFIPDNQNGPTIAEWSKTGSRGDTIILSGSRFDINTKFRIFSQTVSGSPRWALARILRVDAESAAVQIPSNFPLNALYLILASNKLNFGPAIRINAPEVWWTTNQAQAGGKAALYGRNLTLKRGAKTKVYLRKIGSTDAVPASILNSNPYKIEFLLPKEFTNGNYEAFVHTGEGGTYGWSMPKTLEVTTGSIWDGPVLNVTSYGAKGDGVTDNFAAVTRALADAYRLPNSTIYFPNGNYKFSQGFMPPPNTRWKGESKTGTVLQLSAGNSRGFLANVTAAVINNVSLNDFTLDSNGNLSSNPLSLIFLRSTDQLEINNMVLKSKGYSTLDLLSSTHVRISNSDIIGMGSFIGGTRQVFFDSVNFFGTNDAPYLVAAVGAREISLERSTCRDFDKKAEDGFALGRFFISQGNWGTNADIYFAENTTFDLGYRQSAPAGALDKNSGEQFLHEGATIFAKQRGVVATADTVTFNTPIEATSVLGQYVRVIDGPGVGQIRKIVSLKDNLMNSFVLDRPWNQVPSAESFVEIGAGLVNAAVYKNRFSAKDFVAGIEEHNGSNGVMCFGGCQNWEVTDNFINKTRWGVSIWGLTNGNSVGNHQEQVLVPSYYNLIQNNIMTGNRVGIDLISSTAGSSHTSLFGTVFRSNTISNPVIAGVEILEQHVNSGVKTKMNMFESNTFTEAKTAFMSLDNGTPAAEVKFLMFMANKATNNKYPDATCFQIFPSTSPVFERNVCTGYVYGTNPQ